MHSVHITEQEGPAFAVHNYDEPNTNAAVWTHSLGYSSWFCVSASSGQSLFNQHRIHAAQLVARHGRASRGWHSCQSASHVRSTSAATTKCCGHTGAAGGRRGGKLGSG